MRIRLIAQVRTDLFADARENVRFAPAECPSHQSSTEQRDQVPGHDVEIDLQTVLTRNQNVVKKWNGHIGRHQTGGRAREREQESENNHCRARLSELT